jgi:hypothetical protein
VLFLGGIVVRWLSEHYLLLCAFLRWYCGSVIVWACTGVSSIAVQIEVFIYFLIHLPCKLVISWIYCVKGYLPSKPVILWIYLLKVIGSLNRNENVVFLARCKVIRCSFLSFCPFFSSVLILFYYLLQEQELTFSLSYLTL